MIYVAILVLVWLLPTFVFVVAAMFAILASLAGADAAPSTLPPPVELVGAADIGV
ncbi:hypothetical protein [Sphingomonas sp. AX6]|uniref:hypothetical protein n=1 Tax=Sphingomonas sp. AX6 TaxID=2653171 RepID=UPI0012F12A02|nr:hypothetical protein [Sphingomonas sp. AX6]VXC98624.1 hypothetical protein SPHINGOAX6_70801 [Sphingomonas sp. AX6]